MKSRYYILISLLIIGVISISYFIFYRGIPFNSNKDIIEMKGTIKYIDLEGGFYGIIGEDGKKYMPLNLGDEFKKDGLKIWFKGKIKKEVATVQMWGTPIEILEVKTL